MLQVAERQGAIAAALLAPALRVPDRLASRALGGSPSIATTSSPACPACWQRRFRPPAGSRRPAEGISLLLQALTTCRTAGVSVMMPFNLMTLAEVYGNAAQPEEGLNRLAEAGQLIETTQERWAETEMHRLRGTLLLSMHEHTAAENSFLEALAVAQRQGAKFWELRAATSLARLWRDQGKRRQAHDLLAPIYGWFTEGFNTLDLKQAKSLLEQLTA